jgi:Uma2 family endonuclease
MTTQVASSTPAPAVAQLEGVSVQVRQFSADEYQMLFEIGVMSPREGVEFIDGFLELDSCRGNPDHVVAAVRGDRPVFLRRFSVADFDRMLAAGMFDDRDRIELLEGMIIQMPTLKPPHSVAICKANELLPPVMPEGWIVRFQLPIVVGGSERAPDIAVVRGPIGRYLKRHPKRTDIVIVGEIADTTLKKDRQVLSALFARDRIPVYWIINIPDAQIEVYTQPSIDDTGAAYYKSRQDYGRRDVLPVVVLSRVVAKVRVRDLLP